MQLRAISLV